MNFVCFACGYQNLANLKQHFYGFGFGHCLFNDNTSFWFPQRVTPPHFIGANSLQKPDSLWLCWLM